jgi:predicted amidohydrolase YtcJ
MLRCNLSELYVLDAYERVIAEYAAANPDSPWILGGGWYMDVFPGGTPTKEALDAIVPDRPAFLTNRDGHGAWVNTRALELAGITRDTPDPRDGRIERNPDGEPSGTLHEGAMTFVTAVAPVDTDEDYAAGLRVAQAYSTRRDTTWRDAIVGTTATARWTYARGGQRGLTARVIGGSGSGSRPRQSTLRGPARTWSDLRPDEGIGSMAATLPGTGERMPTTTPLVSSQPW